VPCRREIPELVELHEAYEGRPVEIVGIAVDSGEAEDIREFADGFGVQYHLWITEMETALADFEAVGYPFTLIIDQDGGIVKAFYGPQTVASLTGEIDALLK
jgi:thiol-disulfide isomerase/thioredoxin